MQWVESLCLCCATRVPVAPSKRRQPRPVRLRGVSGAPGIAAVEPMLPPWLTPPRTLQVVTANRETLGRWRWTKLGLRQQHRPRRRPTPWCLHCCLSILERPGLRPMQRCLPRSVHKKGRTQRQIRHRAARCRVVLGSQWCFSPYYWLDAPARRSVWWWARAQRA